MNKAAKICTALAVAVSLYLLTAAPVLITILRYTGYGAGEPWSSFYQPLFWLTNKSSVADAVWGWYHDLWEGWIPWFHEEQWRQNEVRWRQNLESMPEKVE